jgi:predicted Zn-dependent protease
MGKLERYVSEVEALLSDERADASAHVRFELLLRLGQVLEIERKDLDRAAELYAQAETTGVRKVDVWRALARVAGARGDSSEEARLLGLLASLGEDQSETRADFLYRLAEVRLASADTLMEGVEALTKAVDQDLRVERAGLVLRRASEQHPDDESLLDLYERVARRSEDDALLLHYLERRVAHSKATPEQAREATELARKLEQMDRAEQMMTRAIEIAEEQLGDDLQRIDWALLGLAERRMDAGDVAGAVKWIGEASEVAEPTQVFALAHRIAEQASSPNGDLTLAAKLYQRLMERDPTARDAWLPLASIYRRLGDIAKLERMVEETLDGLQDRADRNTLRLELARVLLHDESRSEDAVELLQQVLSDNPDHDEAQNLLVEHLERSGRGEELVALLQQQLASAKEREDAMAVKAASLRLGRRLESESPEQGLAIYRDALEWAPEDAELLTVLLSRLDEDDDPRERASLTERLVKVEPAERAGERALELVAIYEALDDADGVKRALQLGNERAPDHPLLRERLQQSYRESGDFVGLARMLSEAAEKREDPEAKVALLREAAQVHREHLNDAAGAARMLEQASTLMPDSLDLRLDLAVALSRAGEHGHAIAALSESLESTEGPGFKLRLLVGRAEAHAAADNEDARIQDLEQAFEIDPGQVAPMLELAYDQRRQSAALEGNTEIERHQTMRQVEMMLAQGKRAEGSDLLRQWCDKQSDDVEALRRLRDIDTADERWEAVAATCRRLVEVEEGSAQVDAVLVMAHAYHALGQPESARDGLEKVRDAQPDNQEVRAELRKLYEAIGDQHKLASLLIEDSKAV